MPIWSNTICLTLNTPMDFAFSSRLSILTEQEFIKILLNFTQPIILPKIFCKNIQKTIF